MKYLVYVTQEDGFEVVFTTYLDVPTDDKLRDSLSAFTQAIREWSEHYPNDGCSFRVQRAES